MNIIVIMNTHFLKTQMFIFKTNEPLLLKPLLQLNYDHCATPRTGLFQTLRVAKPRQCLTSHRPRYVRRFVHVLLGCHGVCLMVDAIREEESEKKLLLALCSETCYTIMSLDSISVS